MKTKLMNHQLPAFEKLKNIKIGALFMEMGTGKTRVAIELINYRLSKIDRVIWFCPVSIKRIIYDEFIKHSSLDIIIFNTKQNTSYLKQSKIIIVGIEPMSSSNNTVLKINQLITKKTFVIVDESHYIKGHRSIRTSRITKLSYKSKYRLLLSGTPISQGVVDLYSQMKFLSPKILKYNSFYSFSRNHLVFSETHPGLIVRTLNENYIAKCISPYVYQVTKQECFDLPKKIYKHYYFNMSHEQRETYNQIKDELLFDISIDDFRSYTLFRLFTKLQQIVSGFVVNNKKVIPLNNNRVDLLIDIISNIPKFKKIIVWVKYRYDIKIIKHELTKLNQGVSEIHGGLNDKEKKENLKSFRNNNRFLISTSSCGGVGVTLTECHYSIFYNNEFKYSNRLQSEDRTHRIGQTHNTTYIDLICEDSIDERIMVAITKKSNVVNAFKQEIDKTKTLKSKIKKIKGL